ncbi:MAG TPA: hypothetical protein PLD23_04835 [Armatimonadota bacterium]|nr:hypothetical protein [Armatimonadota bacterium]
MVPLSPHDPPDDQNWNHYWGSGGKPLLAVALKQKTRAIPDRCGLDGGDFTFAEQIIDLDLDSLDLCGESCASVLRISGSSTVQWQFWAQHARGLHTGGVAMRVPHVGVCALLALASLVGAQDPAPPEVSLRADVDGDGEADRVAIVRVGDTAVKGVSAFAVEVVVGGGVSTADPIEAVGPLEKEPPLPESIGYLQVLPDGPLCVTDLDGDGSPEIIARLRLPTSRTNVETLVYGYDPAQKSLRGLWGWTSDGVLGMYSEGVPRLLLLPYRWLYPGCPEFGPIFAWRDGKAHRSLESLPPRLAAELPAIYTPRYVPYELRGDPDTLDLYVRGLMATGENAQAIAAAEDAIGRLDYAESQIAGDRRRALMVLGDARAASGAIDGDVGALEAYRQAYAMEREEGFASPEGFAALHAALALAAAGDRDGALHWLDEAEKAEGQPGKFAATRERIPPKAE